MVRLPEDLRVLQISWERPIRYIVTNMVKGQEPPSTTTTVYRDKYGQRTGTSTTRQTGNSSTTTYKDKYGRIQKRGNSQRK